MKIAIVGCRDLGGYPYSDFCTHIPQNCTVVISGGARGIDSYARRYAVENDIPLAEMRPDYGAHPGRSAPIVRNREIVEAADYVLAFWDGKSRGTRHVIGYCMETQKAFRIIDITKGYAHSVYA